MTDTNKQLDKLEELHMDLGFIWQEMHKRRMKLGNIKDLLANKDLLTEKERSLLDSRMKDIEFVIKGEEK